MSEEKGDAKKDEDAKKIILARRARFVAAVALYWVLCLAVERLVGRIEVFAEARR